jgi:predicted acylesterase/phospholipase RssA
MMGNYHFGHVKALLACNVLPHIISGTSAGSVVAAFVCTRTDAELERDLKSEVLVHRQICFSKSWPDCIRNAYAHGCLFDSTEWLHLIEWYDYI